MAKNTEDYHVKNTRASAGNRIEPVKEPYTRQGRLFCLEEGANRVIKSKINANHGVWAAIVIFNPDKSILVKTQLTNEYFVVVLDYRDKIHLILNRGTSNKGKIL